MIPKPWTLPWLRDSRGSAGESKASRGEDQVVDTPAQTSFEEKNRSGDDYSSSSTVTKTRKDSTYGTRYCSGSYILQVGI
jgi:hypothetical protein